METQTQTKFETTQPFCLPPHQAGLKLRGQWYLLCTNPLVVHVLSSGMPHHVDW